MKVLHFVIPPSRGNLAGIERVTLLCAQELRNAFEGVDVKVHMFGTYALPDNLKSSDIVFHPEATVTCYGRYLRPYIGRSRQDVWIICQPMTLLAIMLWNPGFLIGHHPAVILHGSLHIEMQGPRRRAQHWLFSKLLKRFRLPVAAVSRDLARYAESRLALRPLSVRTLHNPVLRNLPDKPNSRPDPASFRCIAVGRLHEGKGFDLLVRAFHASHLGSDARLVILGEGPQREELQRAIDNGAKAAQIKLLGHREDVIQQISASTLFLMTSRYEALGGALIEALSCGIRIVSTDYRFGARDLLASGKFGTLIGEPYVEGLRQALNDEYDLWLSGDSRSHDPGQLAAHLKKFEISEAAGRYKVFIEHVMRGQQCKQKTISSLSR